MVGHDDAAEADRMMALARSITCRELADLVTEYTEEALEGVDRARFEAHLALCTGCKHHVDHVHVTVGTLRRLGRGDVTDEARAQLVALFRSWRSGWSGGDRA